MSDSISTRPMTRREAIAAAAAFGAALAWPARFQYPPTLAWRERRDAYPQGVASGDPQPDGMILWTRRPPTRGTTARRLRVEVALDQEFQRPYAIANATMSAESDWTCRVLVAGLQPSRPYWYRFIDEHGFGSRIGRTLTAPSSDDPRTIRFAFVSCQNVQQGACNAYRRMIWEDARGAPDDQLDFVLHLGDFVYEVVWYPPDRPRGMYARRLRDIVRYPHGEKHGDFHVPTTLADYRALYRAYLLDPDLQDARARWPFVCVPDNHEFSWKGWQSQENFGTGTIPSQTRKVAANQAWFEYQPARVARPGDPADDRFQPPRVADAPLLEFDENGLGREPGNLAAVGSLTVHRSQRWGRNVELILTDNRSFRSEPLSNRPETAAFRPTDFPAVVSEDVTEVLDAGRAMNDGQPPPTIRFGGKEVPNPRVTAAPQSMLGAAQKAWFLGRLGAATAPWKLWGNSVAMLDWRTDFQNLPRALGPGWPTTGYALFGDDDWSGYRHERREILEFIRQRGITGIATICGDRHAFLAGVLSSSLPPKAFEPVAVEFVTGSISAPGLFEAMQYTVPRKHPLRPVYVYDPVYDPSTREPAQPAINVSIMHGVRASLALQRTGHLESAIAASNPEVAPHLSFVDAGGHGYAVVRADPDELAVEFVCIPRPINRAGRANGGPIAYRVTHCVRQWRSGEAPRIERTDVEGQLPLVE